MQKTSHAIFNRIYVRAGLLAALVGGLPLISQAAYVYPGAPDGWRGNRLMTKGEYAAKTVLDSITGKVVFSPNALTVPTSAGSVKLPVAYRFGSAASKVAAAAIFLSPHLRFAVGVASWLGTAKLIYDEVDGMWKEVQPPFPGMEWHNGASVQYGGPFSSAQAAGEALRAYYSGNGSYTDGTYCTQIDPKKYSCSFGNSNIGSKIVWATETPASKCPEGWTLIGNECKSPPIQEPRFIEKISPVTLPDTVPIELPSPTHLPVDDIYINPDPGSNPQSKPKFIPTGNPVPNPNYDPQKAPSPDNMPWNQPGVKLTPSPSVDDPWRIDIEPVNRPQPGPEPVPDTPDQPQPDDNSKPQDQQSLCEKHPDILACAKPELDTPDGEIPKSKKDVSLKEENLFGGGSCPADVYFSPSGLQQMKVWDWNKSCGYITKYVKPILILTCTFSAFMILVPGRTE